MVLKARFPKGEPGDAGHWAERILALLEDLRALEGRHFGAWYAQGDPAAPVAVPFELAAVAAQLVPPLAPSANYIWAVWDAGSDADAVGLTLSLGATAKHIDPSLVLNCQEGSPLDAWLRDKGHLDALLAVLEQHFGAVSLEIA